MARRLSAILAADVVGFSRLMGADEAGTLDRLKALRRELVQPKIREYSGRIVKLMGDGLLAEFPSVVDAVRCAVDIQNAIAAHEADEPEERRISLRIGVNLGDIIVEGSDIYGDGVNVAARLEGLAEPGGVCISGPAFDTVEGKLDLVFEDVGPQQVKNIARPVRAYRLASTHIGALDAPEASLPLPDKPSIAVLPFSNMSGDPEQDYFSDGITEDIITELSRFREFDVIARNSSFLFKGRFVKVQDVRRELGARYVVEGSVRKSGDRVRVTTQLIDAETGTHIWADRYDRQLHDIFAIQDEVTEAIVARVADRLRGAGISRSRSMRSITAYDLVLQSRPYRTEWTLAASQKAEELLRQAIAMDANSAQAHAALAFVLAGEYEEGWVNDPDATLCEALAVAKQAVANDDSDGYTHASLAYVLHLTRDFELAAHEANTALSLNPNHANIIMTCGWIAIVLGDPEMGIKHIQRARQLNPYMPGFDLCALGTAYFQAKRYQEAIDVISQVADPPLWSYKELAACHAYLGQKENARRNLKKFLERARTDLAHFPGEDPKAWRAHFEQYVIRRRKEDVEHAIEGARKAGLPIK